MHNTFYNSKRAVQEKEIKTKSQIKGEQRKKYLANLWENKHFQEFVVREIIDAEIEKNNIYTPSVESLIRTDSETQHRTMLSKAGALASIQNIKTKLINPR